MTDQLPRSTSKWIDPFGAEHLITIPAPTVAELLDRLTVFGNHLTANGWTPATGGQRNGGLVTTAETNGAAPVCKYHGPMKESTKKPGSWFCPAKMGDGSYCKEKA